MNCKQGDLAVIVFCPRGTEHLRGRMVRLTTPGPSSPQYGHVSIDTRHTWNYEGEPLRSARGMEICYINDCCLRPIRPNEGDDETLSWAGKPEKVAA